MEAWKEFVLEGGQYLDTARGGMRRKRIFTNEILYNIMALSMEKYLMGVMQFYRKLPEHHTLGALMREAAETVGETPAFAERLIRLDQFQEICLLEEYSRKIPGDEDVAEMLGVNEELKRFVEAHTGHLVESLEDS